MVALSEISSEEIDATMIVYFDPNTAANQQWTYEDACGEEYKELTSD